MPGPDYPDHIQAILDRHYEQQRQRDAREQPSGATGSGTTGQPVKFSKRQIDGLCKAIGGAMHTMRKQIEAWTLRKVGGLETRIGTLEQRVQQIEHRQRRHD